LHEASNSESTRNTRGLGNGGFVIADAKIRDTRRKITARTKVVGTLRLPTPAASTPKPALIAGRISIILFVFSQLSGWAEIAQSWRHIDVSKVCHGPEPEYRKRLTDANRG